MKTITVLLFSTFFLAASAAAQYKSVYTRATVKACKTIESYVDESGYYEGECPGVGGYKLRLIEGDIRQTINVITPKKKTFELNFWSYDVRFSYVGETIEWRVKTGVPIAMIARFNVSSGDEGSKDVSYLYVSKISKSYSCVVAIFGPQDKQNEIARTAADKAASLPCKKSINN